MKKMFFFVVLVIFSVSAVFANGSDSGEMENFEFKLGHLANTEHDWHKALLYYADMVSERTGGNVVIKVFPNEELGKEMDNINAIGLGSADMVLSGESLQNWAPLAALIATPYAINSPQQMRAVAEGEIGQMIFDQVLEKVGLVHIMWMERAPRNLTSNRPISSPDEIDGLVMRVPNVPLFVTAWSALGAKPTTMAFSEVFTSLQQGTIEAQENPLDLIKSASFYEVQDYVNMTEHVRGWLSLWIGEKQFNSLPQEYQQIMLESGKEAQKYYQGLFEESNKRLRSELEAEGMTFIETDQKAFKNIAAPAVLDALTDEQRDLYMKMQDLN